MIDRTRVMALLALPAGLLGYLGSGAVIGGLPLPSGLLGLAMLIVPLFVAGVCMAVLLPPTFDRMARRDLAAHRSAQERARSRRGPRE